jgi:hypothetical protein
VTSQYEQNLGFNPYYKKREREREREGKGKGKEGKYPKSHMKSQWILKSQNILEKQETHSSSQNFLQNYNRNKIVWCWHKDKHQDQRNKYNIPRNKPTMVPRLFTEKEQSFQQIVLRKVGITCK